MYVLITNHLEWVLLFWIAVVVPQAQYHCFVPPAKVKYKLEQVDMYIYDEKL